MLVTEISTLGPDHIGKVGSVFSKFSYNFSRLNDPSKIIFKAVCRNV